MRILLLTILFFIVLLFTSSIAFSQPPPSLPSAPDQAPVDGGLALLAAAGGAYAWKKLRYKVQ